MKIGFPLVPVAAVKNDGNHGGKPPLLVDSSVVVVVLACLGFGTRWYDDDDDDDDDDGTTFATWRVLICGLAVIKPSPRWHSSKKKLVTNISHILILILLLFDEWCLKMVENVVGKQQWLQQSYPIRPSPIIFNTFSMVLPVIHGWKFSVVWVLVASILLCIDCLCSWFRFKRIPIS